MQHLGVCVDDLFRTVGHTAALLYPYWAYLWLALPWLYLRGYWKSDLRRCGSIDIGSGRSKHDETSLRIWGNPINCERAVGVAGVSRPSEMVERSGCILTVARIVT